MPALKSAASSQPTATAPDGIDIHTFDLRSARYLGIAEGRIAPGRYAIHRHLTIEQLTYILEGELMAVSGTAEFPGGMATNHKAGDLLLTSPGESLQLVNETANVAKVLFICSPPYPADDSDTRVLEKHGEPTETELQETAERLKALSTSLRNEIGRRLSALRSGAD